MKKAWSKPLAQELTINMTAGNAYGWCEPSNPHFDPKKCAS